MRNATMLSSKFRMRALHGMRSSSVAGSLTCRPGPQHKSPMASAEHSGRYLRVAEAETDDGYCVYANPSRRTVGGFLCAALALPVIGRGVNPIEKLDDRDRLSGT